MIFIGRENGEYYQVLDEVSIEKLKDETKKHRFDTPTIWALESIQKICGTLGEVSTRVLQGHLKVEDIYPIFGTAFLRHSRPLRHLLEPDYQNPHQTDNTNDQHKLIKTEIQDWIVYHDGLRRRCLILIDLLWAEAARLEDLPPSDMKCAADSKKKTGNLNRKRVYKEIIKLNGASKVFFALRLSRFLRKSEYSCFTNWWGINNSKLSSQDQEWTLRLLRDRYK